MSPAKGRLSLRASNPDDLLAKHMFDHMVSKLGIQINSSATWAEKVKRICSDVESVCQVETCILLQRIDNTFFTEHEG
jgi:hypothetical protein